MKIKLIALLAVIFTSSFCNLLVAQNIHSQDLSDQEKLSSFAKLYGYIRFFHPSQKSQDIDWDRFAIYGAQKVMEADSESDFMKILKGLFEPIAPTIGIYREGESPDYPETVPDSANGKTVVAWQHLGFGFTERTSNTYQSRLVYNHPDSNRLFSTMPVIPVEEDKTIGADLRVRFHLAVTARDFDSVQQKQLEVPLEQFVGLSAEQSEVRAAAVIVAWNIFRHFYPYPRLIEGSWDSMLSSSLEEALNDLNEKEFLITLRKMVSRLNDGHGTVRPPFQSERSKSSGFLPFHMQMIDDWLFVTSDSSEAGYKAGDRIFAVNGLPVKELYEREEKQHSGSPQWKRFQLIERGWIGYGPLDEAVKLTLERNSEQWETSIHRISGRPTKQHLVSPIEQIDEDIMYVDLSRADWKSIDSSLSSIAQSKKVLFDHRAYPKGSNFRILQHLLAVDTTQTEWMHVPKFLFPDQQRLAGYNSIGWKLTPLQPRITGKVYWLAGPGTISYGESILSYVKHFKLGTILGSASAGANGNVASYVLPGGNRVYWTGMKVTRHDGGQHHMSGIEPDIEIIPTIEDITNNWDTMLHKALEIIRNQ